MKRRHYEILGHLIFWVTIVFTYALSEFGYSHSFRDALVYEILFLPIRWIAVYLNWFILIPRILYTGKIVRYLLILALVIFLSAFVQRLFLIYWALPHYFPQYLNMIPEPWNLIRIFQSMIIIASPVAFSSGIRIFLDWNSQKRKSQLLQQEKLDAELRYLRSQINPHFLFNTLNNLYGLSREKSLRVPDLILKLSDFLSYSLYESPADESNLQKEISLVNDFIELETSRHEDRVKLSREFPLFIDEKIKVPSFLLIPLVENAFKHGVREETGTATIHIELTLKDGWLIFQVINSVPQGHGLKGNAGGIGLGNLQRRLEILYKNKHELVTTSSPDQYQATLKLQLK